MSLSGEREEEGSGKHDIQRRVPPTSSCGSMGSDRSKDEPPDIYRSRVAKMSLSHDIQRRVSPTSSCVPDFSNEPGPSHAKQEEPGFEPPTHGSLDDLHLLSHSGPYPYSEDCIKPTLGRQRESPTPSCGSMGSDRSKDEPPDVCNEPGTSHTKRESPTPSCESMGSDQSKDEPPDFSNEPGPSDTKRESQTPSCGSMRSDRSKAESPDFCNEPGPSHLDLWIEDILRESQTPSCGSMRSDRSKAESPDFCNEPGPSHTKVKLQTTGTRIFEEKLCFLTNVLNSLKLQNTLHLYATDTLSHIATVGEFCLSLSQWEGERTAEKEEMEDIIKMEDIKKREDARKNWGERFMTMFDNDATRREELEKKLGVILKRTIGGLEKLNKFVDAVETLAVTSLHVFVEENQCLQLPEGTSFKSVQAVITAAIQVCPLLLQFKREASTFFSPSLHNVEVHSLYLGNYISNTQEICKRMEKSSGREFLNMKLTETVVQLTNVSEDDILDMLDHIKNFTAIRNCLDFRIGFLFQDECSSAFTEKFKECKPIMLKCLTELEETAVTLDNMKKGAQISNVTGSSAGVVGGVLSIVGLALSPVTAGASLGLTMMGAGLGGASGISGIVTTCIDIKVNETQQKKAVEVFDKFMGDVTSLQGYLDEVYKKAITTLGEDNIVLEGELSKAVITSGTNAMVQDIKAGCNLMVHRITDIGMTASKGASAIGKSARRGFIGLNALFIGVDIVSIYKDLIGLAKGSKSGGSQIIRAKASLWHSELDSWQKIYDSLSAEKIGYLDLPFIKKR